jgi:hypothetical protein
LDPRGGRGPVAGVHAAAIARDTGASALIIRENPVRLAISLPVHEAPEVVVDQLRNIRKYVPAATVILHVSQSNPGMVAEVSGAASEFISEGRLIINPERLATTAWNLLSVHVSNFQALEQHGRFDYFCLGASNELFVRPGLVDYVSRYDAGVEGHSARRHWAYRFEIARKLMAALRNDYQDYGGADYPREECLLPTLFHTYYGSRGLRVGRPYIFMPWEASLNITQEMIDGIVAGSSGFRKQIRNQAILSASSHRSGLKWILSLAGNTVRKGSWFGLSDFFFPTVTHLFGVKRIPRVIEDPMRRYVRQLP